MKRLCIVTLLVALGAAMNAIADQTGAGDRPQDATSLALNRIYREYQELKRVRSVDGLVRLDRQLRDLMPGYTWGDWRLVSAAYLEPRYEELGVNRLLFDGDNLGYSGKLLAEAHALNPRTPLRSHTLYSTIFSPDGETSNNVPSRDRAEAYVREFPAGPFVVEALTIVAHFYDDLFKVIRLEENGGRVGYKYDCFLPYLTTQPLADQRRAAQEAGVRAYERLIALRPEIGRIKDELSALKNGTTTAWHSCAD
jgi:hypothetical protein